MFHGLARHNQSKTFEPSGQTTLAIVTKSFSTLA